MNLRMTTWILGTCFLTIWAISAHAQVVEDPVLTQFLKRFGHDEIDWEARRIKVVAVETYPAPHLRLEARRDSARMFAEMKARSRLVAMNFGISVTGLMTLDEVDLDMDAKFVSAGTFLEGALETRVEYLDLSDGSFLAVATVWGPLMSAREIWRDFWAINPYMDSSTMLKLQRAKMYLHQKIQEEAHEFKPKPVVETTQAATAFTGLIVDARSVPNVQRVKLPRIVDERDQHIFGIEDIAWDKASDLVSYTTSLQTARKLAESRPIEVRALRAYPYNTGYLVVTSIDGERILAADARGHFLSSGKVIFLLRGH